SPHMHLRGKAFQLRSYTSRGESKILLDVPRYDFNWQHTYEFEEPVPFSSIDRLEFDVVFDNSEGNPSNPDPEQFVMWGDQTWEEMAVAFFEIATPRNSEMKRDRTVRSRQNPSVDIQSAAAVTDDAASKWADNYIRRFDRDRNGILEKSEVSELVRVYSFHLIDQNGDERLTRDELVRSFEARRGR
ncbi:MAG: alkyl hydroperoxide reductase, partial [Planctomycetes bacterium]|nr:alkyl hydroperoxide reductase [Planctomycetota bacterium]